MRQEKFGIVTKESQEAKKLERMKRFGVTSSTEQDLIARKAARLARFGTPSDDAKPEVKAARFERFGAVDPADLKRNKHFSKKRDKKFSFKKNAESVGNRKKSFKKFKRQKLQ